MFDQTINLQACFGNTELRERCKVLVRLPRGREQPLAKSLCELAKTDVMRAVGSTVGIDCSTCSIVLTKHIDLPIAPAARAPKVTLT